MTATFLAILIVAAAAHRVARAIAEDTISEPARAWISKRAYRWEAPAPPEPNPADVEMGYVARLPEPAEPTATVLSRPWKWAYGLVSCAHCTGFWVSIGLWTLWYNWVGTHVYIAAVAVAGAQSALSAKAS